MQRNLTEGSVFKTLLSFSVPFFLSYFLQTLYGMADLYITGQFNGVAAITAVSIGSQVLHMLTVMIVGLAMGTTVMIGKAIGAGNTEKASLAIGNTVTLFMGLSVALTCILVIFVKPIIHIMSTPAESVESTITYLTICFLGIPFITAYNIISSIFRGLGDSKSPMYFVAIACAANIVLDYIFIGVLSLGAAGAALGTTLAQTISVISALCMIRRKQTGLTVQKTDLKPVKKIIKELFAVGFPIAVQDGFIQIGFIIITIIANMRGLNDAAAVGIVEKMIGVLFLVPSSMLASVSALASQNIGAGKDKRAGQVLKHAVSICIVYGFFVVVLMHFTAGYLIGLFTDSKEVIRLGVQYMQGYAWDTIFAGIHFCFSGFFCACGYSIISFLHNAIAIVIARVPLAYLVSVYFPTTLLPMGLATAFGSALSAAICFGFYMYKLRKRFSE